MKTIIQFLKVASMASMMAATLVACGKNDGGSTSNNNAVYARVNGICADTTNHRSVNDNLCMYTSTNYSFDGTYCRNQNGTSVTKSRCLVDGTYNGSGYNGGYNNGGYNNGYGTNCQADPYTGQQYCQNATTSPNSCYGVYMWYNYATFVRVQCNGRDCAGWQLYDMQGRLVNCQ